MAGTFLVNIGCLSWNYKIARLLLSDGNSWCVLGVSNLALQLHQHTQAGKGVNGGVNSIEGQY